MEVIEIGKSAPDLFVVGSLHGDEPCGKNAIMNIVENEKYPEGLNIKFIIANEKALSQDVRGVDADLNRCFPGVENSDVHEEALAYKINKEIQSDKPILSIHSSVSTRKSFGIIKNITPITRDIINSLDTDYIVMNDSFHDGSMITQYGNSCLEIECGNPKEERTERIAEKEIKNFLEKFNNSKEKNGYDLYKLYEKVQGSDYRFLGENFSQIDEGEVFAIKGDDKKTAEEDFFPVFMSKDGYKNIVGYKAEKIE